MGLKRAKEVLKIEADAIRSLIPRLNASFEKAVKLLLTAKGRIVVTGMGKPGIIAQKLSATLSSTGSPSLWLHPADAFHGDLGRVTKSDIVIALSNSGETEELIKLLPLIKKIGAKLIAITGNIRSTLAKNSDVVLDVTIKREACPLGLAPTASTTAMLAIGDALSTELQYRRHFKVEDFAFYHPGGNLGKRLIRVKDIMRKGKAHPVVKENATVRTVLFAITRARAGSATVVDSKGRLVGFFTDGDLRRHLGKTSDISKFRVGSVMTRRPITILSEKLATEALRILGEKRIDEVPVVDARHRPVGLLDVQDLLRVGLVSPILKDQT